MDIEHLVYMANQIGAFFEGEPDQQVGVNAVANHLKKFWDPRMRKAILQHVEDQGGDGLKNIVSSAIKLNRDLFDSKVSPTNKTDLTLETRTSKE